HHLAPTGSMALLLANGSMSSNTNNEGEIRKNLVEQDIVECMVALPGQLFTNTQIPACIWFLTGDKSIKDGKRDRRGEVLFIDARNLGYMKDRVLRDFKDEDTRQIVDTFHKWQREWSGEDNQAGFSFSADLAAIRKHDFVLTPGRYVGVEAEEDDGIPFADKMATLTGRLKAQFEESDKLEGDIRKNLAGLGFDV
ncbi:MAG: N-6 DNA methylase, partial [Methanosarcinaceae archaeon]